MPFVCWPVQPAELKILVTGPVGTDGVNGADETDRIAEIGSGQTKVDAIAMKSPDNT